MGLSAADGFTIFDYKFDIDRKTIANLMKTGGFSSVDISADKHEPNIEIQLKFLAKIFEHQELKFQIVPVYVGTLAYDDLRYVASQFVNYLRNPENLFVFSASLCSWGEIYKFTYRNPEHKTVIESIKEVDKKAIEALEKLKFTAFDKFHMDTKACVSDNQTFGLILWLVDQYLLEDEYRVKNLPEPEQADAYKQRATFKLLGQAWSYSDVQPCESCISFVAASIDIDKVKYVPEPEFTPEPSTTKCV